MSAGSGSESATPDHYFVEIVESGKTRYVLCGAVASFDPDKVSEATLQGIQELFKRDCLRAVPADSDLQALPMTFELYSFQSGKNQ
ncbi:hypothetical protein [Aurantiacibacter hainanensis]|uniref:hypothetical protein n=1 Tax=Aurantiacibacter hainanensis TaxID=3076114 RepID=UPI0030C703C3